jgi:hypothetical protein
MLAAAALRFHSLLRGAAKCMGLRLRLMIPSYVPDSMSSLSAQSI